MKEIWEWINSNSNSIMAITTFLAGVIALFAWRISRRTTRYQILNDLFKEYRSYEMGRAMQDLWDFRRKCENKNTDSGKTIEKEMIDKYKKEYEKDATSKNSLHMKRRMVSTYFQNLACLAIKDIKIMKIINEIWIGSDMSTIPKIIEILEMRALPGCTGRSEITNVKDYPGYMNNMLYLYESVPGYQLKYLVIRIRRRILKILGLRH
jgi:hypothetical protein